jgi:hypothetical protein
MSFSPDRRRFLGTALAGAAVIVAFDPVRGGWVTAAEAAGGAPAGATWLELVTATVGRGLTPPV